MSRAAGRPAISEQAGGAAIVPVVDLEIYHIDDDVGFQGV